jgi:leucyl-tRNA synthetase
MHSKLTDIEQDKEIMELRLNMAEIKTDMKYTKEKVNSIESKLDKFIECADNKYAGKDIEQTVKEHSKKINKMNLTMAKYVGYASGIVAIVVFIINKFL